jgi:hypothetical protein
MSKPSKTDQRYDRYAEIFDAPFAGEYDERGHRALHHEFMENHGESYGRDHVEGLAYEARKQAVDRIPDTPGDPDRAYARGRRIQRARSRGRSR